MELEIKMASESKALKHFGWSLNFLALSGAFFAASVVRTGVAMNEAVDKLEQNISVLEVRAALLEPRVRAFLEANEDATKNLEQLRPETPRLFPAPDQ